MSYSRRVSLTLCAVVVALLAPLIAHLPAQAVGTEIVSRQGRGLLLGGQPYRFTGVNAYHLTTDWSINHGCGEATSSADLDALFATLRPNSAVRVWAFQRQAFNKYTGQLDFTTIDRVVNAAAARNQKVILTIGNHWGECDGPAKDDAWYAGGYRSVAAWPEGSMPLSYWDWLHQIVPRYAGNPAVAMWEPVNEPEVACGSVSTLRTFFDAVGQEMHRLDPSHLVSSGVIGGNQCGLSGEDYVTVHQSPGIDVATYHDYSADVAMPSGLALRVDQMTRIGKPLLVGEAGIEAGDGLPGCMSIADRAARFRSKMDAQLAAGVVGYLPWLWSKSGAGQCGYNFRTGDPLLTLLHDYPLTTTTPTTTTPTTTTPTTTTPTTTTTKPTKGTKPGSWKHPRLGV